MSVTKNECERITNQELLEDLSHEPAPINLHLYQPPRLLKLSFKGRTNTVFDITGIYPSSPGFNHLITGESYLPLVERNILTNDNISWDLYGITADWLEVNYPDMITSLRNSIDSGAKPPVGDTYLHIIFPFLSTEHKNMLLKISKTVYKERWGADPETIWLPESAADKDTIASLIRNGYRGVHLREHQVSSNSSSNLYSLCTRFGKILAITGHNYLSGKVGFDKPWADKFFHEWSAVSHHHGFSPRISIDGETLGHWWKDKDGAFAFTQFLLQYLNEGRYGDHLDFSQNTIPDGELVNNTSWSCPDSGLGRWKGDSSCSCDLPKDRYYADHVRSSKRDLFEKLTLASSRIDETLDTELPGWREVYVDWFLSQRRSLAVGSPISARFLGDKKLERLFLSAYTRDLGWTSCGWFFGDIGGFERQIPANSLKAISGLMKWEDVLPADPS